MSETTPATEPQDIPEQSETGIELACRLYKRIERSEKKSAESPFVIHCEIAAVAHIIDTGYNDSARYLQEQQRKQQSESGQTAVTIAASTLDRLKTLGAVDPATAKDYIERRVREFVEFAKRADRRNI